LRYNLGCGVLVGTMTGQNSKRPSSTPPSEPAIRERVGHKQPPVATRFKPGQSGNPSGKHGSFHEVQKLARELAPAAIARLGYWLKSKNAKASILAANSLLDRAYGKPAQAITGADGGPIQLANAVQSMTDEQLLERVAQIAAKRLSKGSPDGGSSSGERGAE
jgi:hypothetical protein